MCVTNMYMFVFSRRADPKMAAFNSGFKLVSRLTMHDLKAVQDAFMVTSITNKYIFTYFLVVLIYWVTSEGFSDSLALGIV